MNIELNKVTTRMIITLIASLVLANMLMGMHTSEREDNLDRVESSETQLTATTESNITTTKEGDLNKNPLEKSSDWVKDKTVNRVDWENINPLEGFNTSAFTQLDAIKTAINKMSNGLNQIRNWTGAMDRSLNTWNRIGGNVPFFNVLFLSPLAIFIMIIFIRVWIIQI